MPPRQGAVEDAAAARPAGKQTMKTILIRVDEFANASGGYPVSIALDDGTNEWAGLAEETTALDDADPPTIGGEPVTPESIRRFMLAEDEESEDFREIGRYLYRFLARGNVGAEWEKLARRRGGLRLFLDIRPKELRYLPWELMRGPSTIPLFQNAAKTCVRVQALPDPAETRPCSPTLRILVVLGVDPKNNDIGAGDELDAIMEAFAPSWGFVDEDILDRPSRSELQSYLQDVPRPHILHFIGHGRAGKGDGELEIGKSDNGPAWQWAAEDIGADLAEWQPRLVFVNACRSAEISDQEGIWQVGDVFADLQVPAVIAMQGDIQGAAAAAFARRVYKALADDTPIDVAVALGRAAMNVSRLKRDPWLPSLTLSVMPDAVLPKRYAVTDVERGQIERRTAFASIGYFVDRKPERRRLWRGVGAANGDGQGAAETAIVVTGDKEVGKSELVKWCLALNAFRGGNVGYVDVKEAGAVDFVGILGAIARELSSGVHAAQNERAFADWAQEFDHLLVQESGDKFRWRFHVGAEESIPALHAGFCRALENAAAGRSLVVALDHLHMIEENDWKKYVAPLLVEPIAGIGGPLRVQPNVRLILVVNKELALPEQLQGLKPIEVPDISVDEYEKFARQYLLARGFSRPKFEPFLTQFARDLKGRGRWKPSIFSLLDQYSTLVGWL
jgi:CHAT domain